MLTMLQVILDEGVLLQRPQERMQHEAGTSSTARQTQRDIRIVAQYGEASTSKHNALHRTEA